MKNTKKEIFKGTIGELKQIAKGQGMFEFEDLDTINEVLNNIEKCEGKHTQQVVFSTHHNALTQICFDCKKIRSNIQL